MEEETLGGARSRRLGGVKSYFGCGARVCDSFESQSSQSRSARGQMTKSITSEGLGTRSRLLQGAGNPRSGMELGGGGFIKVKSLLLYLKSSTRRLGAPFIAGERSAIKGQDAGTVKTRTFLKGIPDAPESCSYARHFPDMKRLFSGSEFHNFPSDSIHPTPPHPTPLSRPRRGSRIVPDPGIHPGRSAERG